MSKKQRVLTEKDKKRLVKLNDLKTKIESGKHVQNKTLKNSLLGNEYEQLFEDWNYQKEVRTEVSSKPTSVNQYEEKLKKAIFLYNRGDKYSQMGKNALAKKLINQSESEFEKALNYLENELIDDPNLHRWFDRSLNFRETGELSLNPGSMPRVITSRSVENQSSDLSVLGKMTKREVKIKVINHAIDNLLYETLTDEEADEKIKKLINDLRMKSHPTVKF